MTTDLPELLHASDVETWSDEVDVVVVGFGIAGACAALEAARAGASVVLLERAAEYGGTSAHGRWPLLPRRRYSGAEGHRCGGLRRGDVQVPDGGQPRPRRGEDPRVLRGQRGALRLDRSARDGVRAVPLRAEGRDPAGHRGPDVHRQREGPPLPRPRRPAPRGHKVPKPGDTGGARSSSTPLAERMAETDADVRYETGATNLVVDVGPEGAVPSSASPGGSTTTAGSSARRRS